MTVHEMIYASRPFGYDNLTLYDILTTARRNNGRDGITGALICREDVYLQLLEGPEQAVAAAYKRIVYDGRHSDIQPLVARGKPARLFPEWAMRDDPAESWMWTYEEVAGGALERASPDAVVAVFERLALTPPLSAAALKVSGG